MTQQDQKQAVGVWVDHQKAIIIANEAGEYAVKDKVEAPGVFVSGSELHIDNASRADLHAYFKRLAIHLQPYNKILLFGTGIAQEQLRNYLNEDAKFNGKEITVQN